MTREEYKEELIEGMVDYKMPIKQGVELAYKNADETNPNGWHPASDPPKEDGEYLVLTVWGPTKDMPFYAKFENGKWSIPQVNWWIVLPKEG